MMYLYSNKFEIIYYPNNQKSPNLSMSGLYRGTFQKFTDDKFDRSQYTYVGT